jgi:hypothetical protein
MKQQKWSLPVTVAAILLLTLVAYYPSLDNRMLKFWDDQDYVTNSTAVKSLSAGNVVEIFRHDNPMTGNYHPLTTLSLAFNYHFSELDPYGYILTNLLLHLLNTLLVFLFVRRLAGGNTRVAAITALLFGLSPVHVESVAWISERKDVLYTFFFLGSLIAYQHYLEKKGWLPYALSLVLFICALLSKAMAASLPLVLILLHWAGTRRRDWKLLVDKIPFFVVALLMGMLAVKIQAEGEAITEKLPVLMRFLHATYGFTAYLPKILFPLGLSAYYPYPYPQVNGHWVTHPVPVIFYLTLLVSVAIFCFAAWCVISGKKNLQVPGFGLLFYAVTIALVLQFLPVGRVIMADRYAYVPSIGIFFIAGYYFDRLSRIKSWRIPAMALAGVYACFFLVTTRQQVKTWKNDETLWNRVISLYPDDSRLAVGYTNRGSYLLTEGRPQEALQDLLRVAQWNPGDWEALQMIGQAYGKDLGDLENSVRYLELSYRANPQNLVVIRDLATAYGMKGDVKSSLDFALKGLAIKGDDAYLLYFAGVGYSRTGQAALGEEYIRKALEINPDLRPH